MANCVYLDHDVAALPEVLQDHGYHTLLSGKWHLGYKDGFIPAHRGFDRSWALMPGCSNHFGWEPAYEGGEAGRPKLPGHMPPLYLDGDRRHRPEPNTGNSSEGFYSSSYYVDNLIGYLQARDSDQPFFAYLPFAAPHWPLQCLPEDRDRYKGRYDDGPYALRQRRVQAMKNLGIVSKDVHVPEMVSAGTKDWDEMTPGEKKMSSRAMEVYAGMIHAMDREIGKVVQHLEDIGELDNTVVMFMSDNGAEGAAMGE